MRSLIFLGALFLSSLGFADAGQDAPKCHGKECKDKAAACCKAGCTVDQHCEKAGCKKNMTCTPKHHESVDGDYTGKGRSNSADTEVSHYTVTHSIRAGKSVSHYKFAQGKEMEIGMTWTFTKNGYFTISGDKVASGEGYCKSHRWCHYEMVHDGAKVEETIVKKHGHLFRLGSAVHGDKKFSWEEMDTRVVVKDDAPKE